MQLQFHTKDDNVSFDYSSLLELIDSGKSRS